MCLDLSKLHYDRVRPVRKGNVRYKVLTRVRDAAGDCFMSYHYPKIWKMGKRHRCGTSFSVAHLRRHDWHNEGLHVFVHLSDAKRWLKAARPNNSSDLVLVRLHMEEHIASGSWYSLGYASPSETWRWGTIVKICA